MAEDPFFTHRGTMSAGGYLGAGSGEYGILRDLDFSHLEGSTGNAFKQMPIIGSLVKLMEATKGGAGFSLQGAAPLSSTTPMPAVLTAKVPSAFSGKGGGK